MWMLGEEKNQLPVPGIKPHFLSLNHSLVTILPVYGNVYTYTLKVSMSGTKRLPDVRYENAVHNAYLSTSISFMVSPDLFNSSLDILSCFPCHTFYALSITLYITWYRYNPKNTNTNHLCPNSCDQCLVLPVREGNSET